MIKRLFGIDKAKVVNTDKVVPAKRTRTGKSEHFYKFEGKKMSLSEIARVMAEREGEKLSTKKLSSEEIQEIKAKRVKNMYQRLFMRQKSGIIGKELFHAGVMR